MITKLTVVILLNLLCVYAGLAQTTLAPETTPTTAFTYQGKLTDTGTPSATYDFQFALYDLVSGGTQQGSVITKSVVPVTNGIFTVTLDFGNQFPGADRFLDISVKQSSGGVFTPLTPRQAITSAPHSIRSLSSTSSDGLSSACVGCVTNTHIQSLDGGKLTGTITGDGSGITNINGGSISNGTVTVNQLAPNLIDGPQRNLALLGSLRWDLLKGQSTFTVVGAPSGIVFDGANIWVANDLSSVLKLRASDGVLLGTFAAGNAPTGVAFDGANIWVANENSNNVTKLRASDGSLLGTFGTGAQPYGVAFDGVNIWVANSSGNSVTKLRASDGALQGTFAVGTNPYSLAFDGASIWVANFSSNTITKLRASDGLLQSTFAVGFHPFGVAFDGANIWTANQGGNVTKLRASDGVLLGTFAAGGQPSGVAFDGANIWVANQSSGDVTELRASDGANLGTFAAGTGTVRLAFDGANIWVANFSSSNNVRRLPPAFP